MKEMREKVTELEMKVKRAAEMGEDVPDNWKMSLLRDMTDVQTRAATAMDPGSNYEELKAKIMSFVNIMETVSPEAMQISPLGEEGWADEEQLAAMGKGQKKTCWICRKEGHLSHECWHAKGGTGKGGGKYGKAVPPSKGGDWGQKAQKGGKEGGKGGKGKNGAGKGKDDNKGKGQKGRNWNAGCFT